MPLILRGVNIVGINAESAPRIYREKIFKIIRKLSRKKLNIIFQTFKFKDLKKILINFPNKKRVVGRKLIKFDWYFFFTVQKMNGIIKNIWKI